MAQNGWKNVAISGLVTAVVVSLGAMGTMGSGKAGKKELKAHEQLPAHVGQQVLNERIDGRLKSLETGQGELKDSIKALPSAIVDEIQRREGP